MLLRWVGFSFLANCLFMNIYWFVDLELLDLKAVKSFYWDLLVTGDWIYEKFLLSNPRNDSSRNWLSSERFGNDGGLYACKSYWDLC